MLCVGTYKHAKKTHMCCVGNDWKRKENISLAWEEVEHARKTQVLRGNLWKTHGKHKCCVGTYRRRKEKTGVALEPMENTCSTWEQMENVRET